MHKSVVLWKTEISLNYEGYACIKEGPALLVNIIIIVIRISLHAKCYWSIAMHKAVILGKRIFRRFTSIYEDLVNKKGLALLVYIKNTLNNWHQFKLTCYCIIGKMEILKFRINIGSKCYCINFMVPHKCLSRSVKGGSQWRMGLPKLLDCFIALSKVGVANGLCFFSV